jgi:hypothetical protein
MVKIAKAEPAKFTKGSLDSIKANRNGDVWKLKTNRTSKDTGC